MKLYDELIYRGGIKEVTDEAVIDLLNDSKLRFYLGIDPTADSMHVGHLFGLINCRRLQQAGHEPILLVGGATGMIGDPSGRNSERQLLTAADIEKNVNALKEQISRLITPTKMVNNYDWTVNLSVIDFLRDVGKNFSINNMLNKESVKSRLDAGISYTEFSYQVLQAYDFLNLFENEECNLQVGGTEQWGNIVAGIDLIRKNHGSEAKAYGMVWPLITKSDGTKFGKSASGAVWLDKEKTSPYEFYQFWLNQADEEAVSYVRKYTFLDHDVIKEIEEDMKVNPHLRRAQKELGKELTILVHSEEDYNDAIRISEALFNNDIKSLSAKEVEDCFKNEQVYEIKEATNLIDLLIEVKLANSKREAREFIKNNAVSINGDKVSDMELVIDKSLGIEEKFLVIKRGKKLNSVVRFV